MNPTQPLPPPFGSSPGGGPPQGPIPIQPGASGSSGGDNQWMIFLGVGCACLFLFCLCAIGVGGAFWALNQDGSAGGLGGIGGGDTVHITASVTNFVGTTPGIGPGTLCDLPVTATQGPDGSQQCHVVVTCGGVNLYGDAQSGYFPCQFSLSPPSVIGQDTDTSMSDQDGAFFISTMGGNVSLTDDFAGRNGMFTLSATITSTQ